MTDVPALRAPLLLSVSQDIAIEIACALDSPADILRLAMACRRFRMKTVAAPSEAQPRDDKRMVRSEMLSIAGEAARRLYAALPESERLCVPPRRHSGSWKWLGLLNEAQQLRAPLVFAKAHDSIALSDDGVLATIVVSAYWCTAVTNRRMRAGRHFAEFTQVLHDPWRSMFFGVVRPDFAVNSPDYVNSMDGAAQLRGGCGHCFYLNTSGKCYPSYCDWEGMQGTVAAGDRIGMLLDLDKGSMTIYRNDERLGVMMTGLSGEYSWAVVLGGKDDAVRINSPPMPAGF